MMTCKISSPVMKVCMANYKLSEFPPDNNFPVSLDSFGNVVSTFGMNIWDMTYWCGRVYKFDFNVDVAEAPNSVYYEEASYCFRLIIVFLMWGAPNSIKAETLISMYSCMRQIFKFCAQRKIKVYELYKYPSVFEELLVDVMKCGADMLVSVLRTVYDNRDTLGFKILEPHQINELHIVLRTKNNRQTPYIPDRIANYHLSRSLEMIADYNSNIDSFESLFDLALEGYSQNFKCITKSMKLRSCSPFAKKALELDNGCYYGTFASVASSYGVEDILRKWMHKPNLRSEASINLLTLSKFFTAISLVGTSALAALSGMRKREVNGVHVDCFVTHNDPEFGDVHCICGPTTKTIEDSDARWITCEESKNIVAAMSSVAHLRMKCAIALGIPHKVEEEECPFLILRPYEPWGGGRRDTRIYPTYIRPQTSFSSLPTQCPGFFSDDSIVITKQDFDIAISASPDLDVTKFAVGKPWKFALHQLRRTLLLNARKSNVISLSSIQYQAKHLLESMGRHYDRNFSRLAVNAELKEEYIATAYEVMALKAEELKTPNFFSLISPLHKTRLISYITDKDFKQLKAMARKGEFSLKETLMGVCLRGKFCPYGSADFILGCNKCIYGLVSKERLPVIVKANDWIEGQLDQCVQDGPRKESFEAQHAFTQELIQLITVE